MDFIDKIECGITVSDENGVITYMNDKSAEIFLNDGGRNLIGKSMYDCHSENSNNQIQAMMSLGSSNIYSIEKNGKKKLICQYAYPTNSDKYGLVEISIELPQEIPHFKRD